MNKLRQYTEAKVDFAGRARALHAAIEKEQRITSAINLAMIILNLAAFGVLWSILTVKVLIILEVGVFILRWIASRIVDVMWVKPTLARIEREHSSSRQ